MRQPGSSFKPFVYLPALEAGVPPNQRFLDGPIEVMTPQGVWRPSNYTEGSFNGYVSIRTALQKSLNLVTVRVAQEVGMAKVSETAARFGVIDNMPRYLAMSLGSGETTVLRMAAGYAGFASGGRKVTPTLDRQRAGPPRQGDLAQRRPRLRGLRRRRAGARAAGAGRMRGRRSPTRSPPTR